MDGRIVGRIESFSVELVCQHRRFSSRFDADQITGTVLTGNDASLQVENVAVRVFALAKNGEPTLFAPLHQFAVGDI